MATHRDLGGVTVREEPADHDEPELAMRRTSLTVVPALAALLLAGCGDDGGEADTTGGEADAAGGATDAAGDESDAAGGEQDAGAPGTVVPLLTAEGDAAGTVSFQEQGDAVQVVADVANLAPGFHGFHLHENPECDAEAPDGPFTSAGGHWTSGDEPHGDHDGDLPPLLVGEDGTASATFRTDRFTLGDVADHGGVAVMVHAGPDNLANIPERYTSEDADTPGPDEETTGAGDAGDRAACGVLEPDL